jgi:hypothetical protein
MVLCFGFFQADFFLLFFTFPDCLDSDASKFVTPQVQEICQSYAPQIARYRPLLEGPRWLGCFNPGSCARMEHRPVRKRYCSAPASHVVSRQLRVAEILPRLPRCTAARITRASTPIQVAATKQISLGLQYCSLCDRPTRQMYRFGFTSRAGSNPPPGLLKP